MRNIVTLKTTKNWSKVNTFEKAEALLREIRMTMHVHSARVTWLLLICVGLLQAADAQESDNPTVGPQSGLSAKGVVANLVRRNLERARALGAYHSTRTYRLDYHGFPGSRSAEMVVDVTYQRPGIKDFNVRSEKGSKLIIERVFKRLLQSEKEALTEENQSRVALNEENYSFTLVGYESAPSGSCYVLSVQPRTTNFCTVGEFGWMPATLPLLALRESLPRTLLFGQKRRRLNRSTPKWATSGYLYPIEAQALFALVAMLILPLTTEPIRLQPRLQRSRHRVISRATDEFL